jgi:hypothetical protein
MTIRTNLIIDELARHRVQFEYFCRSLTAEELSTTIPGSHWTVKDYIAHLCTIDGLIAAGFAPMTGQAAPAPAAPMPDPFDIDEWNDAAVKLVAGASVDELLAEAAVHREHMASAIAAMTDEHLDAIIPYGGDRKSLNLPKSQVRFGGLLWGIAIHDPNHTADIIRALPHRGEEPWLKEWLATVTDSLVPAGVKEQRV